MERLLDFTQPFDVPLLEQVVNAVLTTVDANQRNMCQAVLTQLQDHPDAWTKTDHILEFAQSVNTKFYALQVLGKAISTRWKTLPREQREGIKTYIVNLIFKLSVDENTLRGQKLFIGKLNATLVQIIKQEWPHNWPSFVGDICGASRSSETVCENNMNILRMLSEEVFDFGAVDMTSQKIHELKTTFNTEFLQVFQLCEFVLENATKAPLVAATLETLLRFLNWIPLGYIFETKMIDWLLYKFFPVDGFRNTVLKCLTEIAGLQLDSTYDNHFTRLYVLFIGQLRVLVAPETDFASVYDNGNNTLMEFIHDLGLFLCTFFKNHLRLVEKNEHRQPNIDGQKYIIQIAKVDDTEIFKICLEYFYFLAHNLYHENATVNIQSPFAMMGMQRSQVSPRRVFYAETLNLIRLVLVSKMPRPEEVLVEEQDGEIVPVAMKDTDSIALYNSMRETLIYLTHLDYEDTQQIMLHKLDAQVDVSPQSEWSWGRLNTLCWAIGSISGALPEEDEKRFLVTVIRELLGLVDQKRGKDNKAVIASNIMYVVGQYPRFLSAHWKFLKTVVNKLFEFMHEPHPGVQDMACDTFLKISQKCRRKFVTVQIGEQYPFIDELLQNLPRTISLLEPHQVQTFYEAVGNMVQAQTDAHARDTLLARLMELPNQTWSGIMAMAAQDLQILSQPSVAKDLANILKTNARVCLALGAAFASQLGRIYMDMINVYKAYSELMAATINSGQPNILDTHIVRMMRAVKRSVISLVQTFAERVVDVGVLAQSFVPPLTDPLLGDYRRCIPQARDAEVLSLYATLAAKVRNLLIPEVPRILEGSFEVTLSMITADLENFPEHRFAFFNMLRNINQYCFGALLQLSPAQFKLIVDSAVWGVKHTARNIMDIGLNMVNELLRNIAQTDVAQPFYQTYLLPLLQDMLVVLTDTFHMGGFKMQATILQYIFRLVESGQVTVPLWDTNTVQAANNQTFLREYVMSMLVRAFPNLAPMTIQNFVVGLFDQGRDLNQFQTLLRDFLVQMKEFNVGENAGLYEEERVMALEQRKNDDMKNKQQVPGLLGPSAVQEDQGGMSMGM